ncbi:hypothetical protein [Allostreptomyces psammosilenae]|uniref:Uncharacterized protein with HEPN domain n=1 Tax=Allostreptomyces psammosilenae TaxID=1892865 RepID=A0A853AC73_9ACTN|nr:hypothetical protein [Allostreptomyces psammosilenae]NYI08068.1 uncharacterized protein with HEPN domain [Allostreptomyces psammosilenae]
MTPERRLLQIRLQEHLDNAREALFAAQQLTTHTIAAGSVEAHALAYRMLCFGEALKQYTEVVETTTRAFRDPIRLRDRLAHKPLADLKINIIVTAVALAQKEILPEIESRRELLADALRRI